MQIWAWRAWTSSGQENSQERRFAAGGQGCRPEKRWRTHRAPPLLEKGGCGDARSGRRAAPRAGRSDRRGPRPCRTRPMLKLERPLGAPDLEFPRLRVLFWSILEIPRGGGKAIFYLPISPCGHIG
eukprot:scaffold3751_cov117-Isochrysis_galbana.AAC.8